MGTLHDLRSPTAPKLGASRVDEPSLGELGRYTLLRRLAVGGMGELFLARARGAGGFEKLAAIKRILPHLAAQPQFIEMFLDEARVAASLEHPNIVNVYDLGHVNGDYFLVMPYLEGADLSAVLRRLRLVNRTMPASLAVFIAAGVASGLDYAHGKHDSSGRPMQIVHRDISPDNVLVTFEGEVKLLDFGIAKALQTAARTGVGVRKGKARYMSPEQARMLALDHRSDIFSLGVVLYELTTGQPPFRGDNDLLVLNMIATCDAAPPSTIVPGYPRALEAVVMRALARDRDARYQSAKEFRDALDSVSREQLQSASAVELGAFVIETIGSGSAAAVAGAGAPQLVPPPPISGAFDEPLPRPATDQGPTTDATTNEIPSRGRGTPSARASSPRKLQAWPWVLLGASALVASALVAARLAGNDPAPADSPEPPKPAAASQTRASALLQPSADQLVALVNDPRPETALDYGQRREAIRYLRAQGLGARIDEPLQLSRDLMQASTTSRPCEAFDAALATIERFPIPYFLPALRSAEVPNPQTNAVAGAPPDRDCSDLEMRVVSVMARLTPAG